MITADLPATDLPAVGRVAAALAAPAAAGDVFALSGDLGTGKTTFARAFLRARGHRGEVPSPTFTLVQIYDLDVPVWHVDLYRIDTPGDADELGLDEAFCDAITLIEWPERAAVPPGRVDVHLSFTTAADRRAVTVTAHGTAAAGPLGEAVRGL